MQHIPTRSGFGEVLGHPTKPGIRFFFPPPEGEGAGGGSGAGAGGDGGQGGGDGGKGGAGGAGDDEQPLSAADAKALRQQADRLMRDRNSARDQAKAYADLGLTPEEIAQLKADRDAKNGGPTPEQIQRDAEKAAERAAAEKYAAKARTSAAREQATLLGFHDPKVALALLDPSELAKVAVDDDLEADSAAVKQLLETLATAQPYLVKTAEIPVADWRAAGIGGTGGSSKPDPGPGTSRMAAAYAAASSGGK